MKKSRMLLSSVCIGIVAVLAFGAWAVARDEEKVTLNEVPAAVKATILKEAAGANVTEIERETKGGQTIYEAEFLHKGQEIEIEIASDGTLLGREVEDEDDDHGDDAGEKEVRIPINQVPAPARQALRKLAAGANILKVEQETEHGSVAYEAKWLVNGVKHEASVTADGALLESEQVIPIQSAPAAVRKAIAAHFGTKAKVEVVQKTIIVYEAEVEVNGHESELLRSEEHTSELQSH